ncbi:MAG TPA: hypothetical protein VGG64_17375 [Pirellulales bacterium]|jgi:hypothetical protein
MDQKMSFEDRANAAASRHAVKAVHDFAARMGSQPALSFELQRRLSNAWIAGINGDEDSSQVIADAEDVYGDHCGIKAEEYVVLVRDAVKSGIDHRGKLGG